jgi:hypothetical protein
MATSINADNGVVSGVPGLKYISDSSGVLQLQSSGTTGLSINPNGKVIYPSTALSTAAAGTLEYDGKVPYFTPQSTERGLVAGMQYYRLNSGLAGANATTAQNFFGVGVTLSASTIYAFDGYILISKTTGSTSHTVSFGFGGTFTNNNIVYLLQRQSSVTGFSTAGGDAVQQQTLQTAALTVWTGTRAGTTYYDVLTVKGTVSVNAGGTFIPQYSLSAAPGGAYTTGAGSYFAIYPIGASGANISVGTWA